ncbi:MAG: phosphoribosyl-ATP pyrophosphohydrolase [Candidatus Lokiarchaeota archaeon]|nr:phosphoribosyl-ATP pyrophosphohydrolase [Candidatus Lokiarchaeota archaeon]
MGKEKLVRDKIPTIIQEKGLNPRVRTASPDELDKLLRDKILEESLELHESGDTLEIADILEAIYALLEHREISKQQIEIMRKRKHDERGGFSAHLVLDLEGLE